MEKLKLNLIDLQVESFETKIVEEKRGTVQANGTGGGTGGATGNLDSDVVTCGHSCGVTCNATACNENTCNGSCFQSCLPTACETLLDRETCHLCYPDTNPQDTTSPN